MTTKQRGGTSPDGGDYGVQTDGNGSLATTLTSTSTTGSTGKQLKGRLAPDGSLYMVLTDGNGNLI